MFFSLSGCITGLKSHDLAHHDDGSTLIAITRKLKETSYKTNRKENKRGFGNVNLEDYHPIDPVPSSKASVKPGPIEHGAPIIPYIPKPSPPDQPKGPT
ncbi:hypothetical protein L484_010274 [Morus notabilis]|uniref:Uncharacterized protein n=2 Tax=Morus notabilis TaxID=981085 RepID=W9S263_9ROSA|nr:hypothetical protein L484_010274 [Morus notabilis]